METEFDEPRWAVPGLLSEGLNFLVGAPKLGKSWIALNLSVQIAAGEKALKLLPCPQGDVLYLALEDTGRRLQRRLRASLNGTKPPPRLTLETRCEKLSTGGTRYIEGWLQRNPKARMVVVDVFGKIRSDRDTQGSQYQADYEQASELKAIADRYEVCVLAIHHTRKQGADDFLDEMSGTQGLAGAADAILVLKRSRGEADATLSVTGRDVEEAEYALSFTSQTGTWLLHEGPAYEWTLSDTRRKVMQALRDFGPSTPAQVAEFTGISHTNAKQTCVRMHNDDQIGTAGDGIYWVTPVTGG